MAMASSSVATSRISVPPMDGFLGFDKRPIQDHTLVVGEHRRAFPGQRHAGPGLSRGEEFADPRLVGGDEFLQFRMRKLLIPLISA